MRKISTVGERIKECRIEKDVSLEELGEAIGLAQSTVHRYETGERAPKQPVTESIARFFSVSPVWLLGFDVEKHINNIDRSELIRNKLSAFTKELEQLDDDEVTKIFAHFENTIKLYISAKKV